MKFVPPKLAKTLPPEPDLSPKDYERLRKEGQEYREALDKHASKVEWNRGIK